MSSGRQAFEADGSSRPSYTLVVALANPTHVEQLLRTAIDLVTDNDGQLFLVSVIHKHASSPFLTFSDEHIKERFAGDQKQVIDEAAEIAESRSVPVETSLRVGTRVSETLLDVVREHDADALLLGWQDRSRPSDIVLGTTVDPVVRRAPCDVFVERVGTTVEEVDAILLPTDGGPHVDPATDLAGAVARANEATVTVISLVDPDAETADREEARGHVESATEDLSDVAVDGGVRETRDVGDAIVEAAGEHDLVILGATRERSLRRRVVGSVAESVGRRAESPIVIAKRRTERSLLARALGR